MKARLICYSLRNADATAKNSFKRELNGYKDISNNGQYTYKRKGLLQQIEHKMPVRSVVIVGEKDKNKVIRLLRKYKLKHHVFSINILSKELQN